MTLEKAIEILGSWKTDSSVQIDEGLDDALKLGIEAMKRLGEARGWPNHVLKELLQGETKETKC